MADAGLISHITKIPEKETAQPTISDHWARSTRRCGNKAGSVPKDK